MRRGQVGSRTKPCVAPALPHFRSVINAIVSSEEQGGGTFSHPGQARVTRLALAIGKVRRGGALL